MHSGGGPSLELPSEPASLEPASELPLPSSSVPAVVDAVVDESVVVDDDDDDALDDAVVVGSVELPHSHIPNALPSAAHVCCDCIPSEHAQGLLAPGVQPFALPLVSLPPVSAASSPAAGQPSIAKARSGSDVR